MGGVIRSLGFCTGDKANNSLEVVDDLETTGSKPGVWNEVARMEEPDVVAVVLPDVESTPRGVAAVVTAISEA